MDVSSVFAVQTQGRGDFQQWVVTFRLEHSLDCVTFSSLLDVDGSNQVYYVCKWYTCFALL